MIAPICLRIPDILPLLIILCSLIPTFTTVTAAPAVQKRQPLPGWLGMRYDDPRFLTSDDRKVFDNPLSIAKLGPKLSTSSEGTQNRGLYTLHAEYEGHAASHVVLKVSLWYPGALHGSANMAFGEVKALKRANDFIDASENTVQPNRYRSFSIRR